MRTKIIETTVPPIGGILTVLGLLMIFNLIVYNGDVFNSPDNGFFTLFVPITTIIALIIQFSFALPIWKKFKSQKLILGLTLFQFTALLSVISGLIFGLIFWETSFGISELISVSLTGIIAFSVYWTVNLLLLSSLQSLSLSRFHQ